MPESVSAARQAVGDATRSWGLPGLSTDAELVTSELVTNGVLHARTELEVVIRRLPDGLRIEVRDGSPAPVQPHVLAVPAESAASLLSGGDDLDALEELLSVGATTGRGLRLVDQLASSWGCSIRPDQSGKTVWADLLDGDPAGPAVVADPRPEARVRGGDPGSGPGAAGVTHPVRLVAVPVRLALESDMNLEAIIREFQMMELAGTAPDGAAGTLATVTTIRDRYPELRESVQSSLRAALERGDRLADFVLLVPPPAVPAMQHMEDVLDRLAAYCDRGDLLALAPSPELREFRRWWVDEVDRQVKGQPPNACPFSTISADPSEGRTDSGVSELPVAVQVELDRIGTALDEAAEVRGVQGVLLAESLRALGAATVSLSLRVPGTDTVELADSIGLAGPVSEHWRFSGLAEDVPASEAIRTGRPIALRTPAELDVRYPVFRNTPVQADVTFVCVPIGAAGQPPVGALNLSFARSRDFSPADLRILSELGRRAAAALDRAGAGSRRARHRERQELLERVSSALEEAGPDQALTERLHLAVEVAGSYFQGWLSAFVKDADGRPLQVAGSHPDPGQSALMQDVQQRWPPLHAADAVVRCLAEGDAVVFQVVPDELLAQIAQDDDHLDAMRRLGVSSMVVVPVCEGLEVAAALAVSNPVGRYVTDAQVRLAQDLAGRCGR